MGYWLKQFVDGTVMHGTDEAVQRGTASWSRSRLHGMVGAKLVSNGAQLEISGPGEYWQSETYVAQLLGMRSKLLQRRIERRIEPTDKFFECKHKPGRMSINFNPSNLQHAHLIEVRPEWRGGWLILEYDVAKKKTHYYITDHRV
jgi:hypothetical protein